MAAKRHCPVFFARVFGESPIAVHDQHAEPAGLRYGPIQPGNAFLSACTNLRHGHSRNVHTFVGKTGSGHRHCDRAPTTVTGRLWRRGRQNYSRHWRRRPEPNEFRGAGGSARELRGTLGRCRQIRIRQPRSRPSSTMVLEENCSTYSARVRKSTAGESGPAAFPELLVAPERLRVLVCERFISIAPESNPMACASPRQYSPAAISIRGNAIAARLRRSRCGPKHLARLRRGPTRHRRSGRQQRRSAVRSIPCSAEICSSMPAPACGRTNFRQNRAGSNKYRQDARPQRLVAGSLARGRSRTSDSGK